MLQFFKVQKVFFVLIYFWRKHKIFIPKFFDIILKRKRRKTSIFKLLLRLLVLFFLCKLVNSKSSRLNYLTSILVSKPWNNLAKTIGDCSSNKNPQGDIYNITCDYTLVHHIYWRGETIIFCLTAWFFFTLLLHSGLYLFLFENIAI